MKGVDKMEGTHKKGHSNQRRIWLFPIIIFALSQCLFVFFELISWTPNFREGSNLFQKIYETKLFTQWFSPYSTPQFNMITLIFAIAVLQYAVIGAMKNLSSRKQ